jgi:hypothetical protein
VQGEPPLPSPRMFVLLKRGLPLVAPDLCKWCRREPGIHSGAAPSCQVHQGPAGGVEHPGPAIVNSGRIVFSMFQQQDYLMPHRFKVHTSTFSVPWQPEQHVLREGSMTLQELAIDSNVSPQYGSSWPGITSTEPGSQIMSFCLLYTP